MLIKHTYTDADLDAIRAEARIAGKQRAWEWFLLTIRHDAEVAAFEEASAQLSVALTPESGQ